MIHELFNKEAKHEHSKIVSRIAGILADKSHFSQDEVSLIESAAMLHDLGKQFVPACILTKPDKLTNQEFSIIQSHTLAGSDYILRTIKDLLAAYIVSLQHHERIDGSGYANVTNIHAYAKVVAVADVFDALLAKRAYKESWTPESAVSYMRDNASKQFDSEYVDVLIESIDEVLALYEAAA